MNFILKTIFALLVVAKFSTCEDYVHNFLPIEPPTYFPEGPSPLSRRESLQRPEYFDFLNTLYRHDRTKSSLFERKPQNSQPPPSDYSRPYDPYNGNAYVNSNNNNNNYDPYNQYRQKRAVVFRPLFVYRQQQVKRQKVVKRI